jgi:hypothetical protein
MSLQEALPHLLALLLDVELIAVAAPQLQPPAAPKQTQHVVPEVRQRNERRRRRIEDNYDAAKVPGERQRHAGASGT